MSDIVKGDLDRGARETVFLDGSVRNVAELANVSVGKGVYRPGWRWSAHAGAMTGLASERHVGYVLSGRVLVEAADGSRVEVGPGEAFEVGPGHDAWVLGGEPCVAIDFRAR